MSVGRIVTHFMLHRSWPGRPRLIARDGGGSGAFQPRPCADANPNVTTYRGEKRSEKSHRSQNDVVNGTFSVRGGTYLRLPAGAGKRRKRSPRADVLVLPKS